MYSVLILDDNIPTAAMVKKAIPWEEIGCRVVGVIHDGITGMTAIEREKPDLIISDIEMPGLSGLEMIEKTVHSTPNSRVIFISAYEKFTYAHHAIKLGAVDFVIKPFTRMELRDAIDKALAELKKTHPSESEEEKAYSPLMKDVIKYMRTTAYSQITLEMVAENFHMSPSSLGRLIKKETNLRYVELLTSMRMDQAKKLLAIPNLSISDVAQKVGYGDYLTFYKVFVRNEHQSPSDYRKALRQGRDDAHED